jgi:hypothetical protein
MRRENEALRALIDETIPAERSILRRYWRVTQALGLAPRLSDAQLAGASLNEGIRLSRSAQHRGVEIVLCDESSCMETGTYKDLDACLIRASLEAAGERRAAVSSGANLGYALSRYLSSQDDRELFFFHPKSTITKLDAQNFAWPGMRLVSVDLPEKSVKAVAQAFAERHRIPLVPDLSLRFAGSAARALAINEAAADRGAGFDFLAQTVCAGYGPVGIYGCFDRLASAGWLSAPPPKFAGFQQEANSPMVRAWRAGQREISQEHVNADPRRYIEQVLYNTDPQQNYTRLFDVLRQFGGDLLDIGFEEYERYLPLVMEWFEDAGLSLTRSPLTGDLLEKTGLLTGIGIVHAIERGVIPPGTSVLYLLTGGLRRIEVFEPAVPYFEIDGSRPIPEWIDLLSQHSVRSPHERRAPRASYRSEFVEGREAPPSLAAAGPPPTTAGSPASKSSPWA